MSLLRSSFRALSASRQAAVQATSIRSVSSADQGGKQHVSEGPSTQGEIDTEKQSLKAAKAAGTPLLHSSTSALDCTCLLYPTG